MGVQAGAGGGGSPCSITVSPGMAMCGLSRTASSPSISSRAPTRKGTLRSVRSYLRSHDPRRATRRHRRRRRVTCQRLGVSQSCCCCSSSGGCYMPQAARGGKEGLGHACAAPRHARAAAAVPGQLQQLRDPRDACVSLCSATGAPSRTLRCSLVRCAHLGATLGRSED